MSIQLIVGLGNPGAEYSQTRHNAGFWLLDAIAQDLGTALQADKSYRGLMARTQYQGRHLWLLQPQTFMNASGHSVAALARFFKIPPQDILVVHDELDLPPGEAKLKFGGSHAGHNGLRDIHSKMGGSNYWRLRVGIGHPRTLNLQQGVSDFVLHMPSKEDHELIVDSLYRARQAIPALLAGDKDKANRLLAEPKV